MKRKALVIVLVAVVVVSVATYIIGLQRELSELQSLIDDAKKVRITDFSSEYGWMYMGGMTGFIDFNISISNTGVNDVEGLTLEVRTVDNAHNSTRRLDVIRAGETVELQDGFVYGYPSGMGDSYMATLKLGGIVLDVQYLPAKITSQ